MSNVNGNTQRSVNKTLEFINTVQNVLLVSTCKFVVRKICIKKRQEEDTVNMMEEEEVEDADVEEAEQQISVKRPYRMESQVNSR